MNFRTVFDVAQQGYANWWMPAFGLVFITIGALLVFRPAVMLVLLPFGLQGRARVWLSWYWLVLSVLCTIVVLIFTYSDYWMVMRVLATGRYRLVEGLITNFVPMPFTGHGYESFSVHGQHFSYSKNDWRSEFHNTTLREGFIHEGLYVRITYDGNAILRLEVVN